MRQSKAGSATLKNGLATIKNRVSKTVAGCGFSCWCPSTTKIPTLPSLPIQKSDLQRPVADPPRIHPSRTPIGLHSPLFPFGAIGIPLCRSPIMKRAKSRMVSDTAFLAQDKKERCVTNDSCDHRLHRSLDLIFVRHMGLAGFCGGR